MAHLGLGRFGRLQLLRLAFLRRGTRHGHPARVLRAYRARRGVGERLHARRRLQRRHPHHLPRAVQGRRLGGARIRPVRDLRPGRLRRLQVQGAVQGRPRGAEGLGQHLHHRRQPVLFSRGRHFRRLRLQLQLRYHHHHRRERLRQGERAEGWPLLPQRDRGPQGLPGQRRLASRRRLRLGDGARRRHGARGLRRPAWKRPGRRAAAEGRRRDRREGGAGRGVPGARRVHIRVLPGLLPERR